MSKHPNLPMKVIYIYGNRHSRNDGSIVVKPDVDLELNDGDIFALMFFRNDDIKEDNVIVSLSADCPLQDVFDVEYQSDTGRCPLGLDGKLELTDNCFAMLRVKLSEELISVQQTSVMLKVRWASFNGASIDDIYPPEMEIKLKPA